MNYRVVFSKKSLKQLKKFDRYTAALITGWIRKNLENCSNPRQHGRGLVENKSGQWHYRVGEYRIIAEIQDKQVLILIIEVGHNTECLALG